MNEVKKVIKEMQEEQDKAFEAYDYAVSNTLEYFVRQLKSAIGNESPQDLAERIVGAIETSQNVMKSEYSRGDMIEDIIRVLNK